MSDDINKLKWGVINEDSLSLRYPRMIDGDECDTFFQAMDQAADMIADGVAERVSVVRCKYESRGHEGFWYETGDGCVTLECTNTDKWFEDE